MVLVKFIVINTSLHMTLISRYLLFATVVLLSCSLYSCRGSADKKAATEALELIEKKVGLKLFQLLSMKQHELKEVQ